MTPRTGNATMRDTCQQNAARNQRSGFGRQVGWLLIVGAGIALAWTSTRHGQPAGANSPTVAPPSGPAVPNPAAQASGAHIPTPPAKSGSSLLGSIDAVLGTGIELGEVVLRTGEEVFDTVAGLTSEQEKAVGREAHQLVMSQLVRLQDQAAAQRIAALAQPLLDQRRRPEIDYHFTLIDSPDVNAFSHLGGYVYLHRGILELAQGDSELQFILAHELAHGDLRHCARGMTAAVRASEWGGELAAQLAANVYRAAAAGYSEEFEFAADAWAYEAVRRVGHSHDASLQGLQLLLRHYGPEDGRRWPSETVTRIEDHFRTHPPTTARIAALESRRTR